MQLLTLLSDFGSQDSYVGIMKGVIAGIAPTARVIDLTHAIPPQAIAIGSFQLGMAYRYFPEGTVHIAVVDPGVGGTRRPIALQTASAYFVAPDNGLLSSILEQEAIEKAVVLNQPKYWRSSSPSATFHGRDIFAPVGAHLTQGVAIEDLGEAIDPATLQRLDLSPVQVTKEGYQGCIQAIDHFGNLITNLPRSLVGDRAWKICLRGQCYPGVRTYADGAIGEVLGLVGSHDYLEIAVHSGNAAAILGAQIGDGVQVMWV